MPPGVSPAPCHVTTFPSGRNAGFVNVTPPLVGPTCSCVRIRHTGVPQPVHEGEPTVRLKLIDSTGPTYSTPVSSVMFDTGGHLSRVNSSRSELTPGVPGRIAVKSPSRLHVPMK